MLSFCYSTDGVPGDARIKQKLAGDAGQLLIPPAVLAEEAEDGLAYIKINDVMPADVAYEIALLVAQHGQLGTGRRQTSPYLTRARRMKRHPVRVRRD